MLTCCTLIESVINLTYSEQQQFSHNRAEVGLNNFSLWQMIILQKTKNIATVYKDN